MNILMRYIRQLILLVSFLLPALWVSAEEEIRRFEFHDQPALPVEIRDFFLGVHNDTLIVVGGTEMDGSFSEHAYILEAEAEEWVRIDTIHTLQPVEDDPEAMEWRPSEAFLPGRSGGSVAISGDGVLLLGGVTEEGTTDEVLLLAFEEEQLRMEARPALPFPVARPATTARDGLVYVAGRAPGSTTTEVFVLERDNLDSGWRVVPEPPVEVGENPVLASLSHWIYLLGPEGSASYIPRDGWRSLPVPPWWPVDPGASSFGVGHVFVLGTPPDGDPGMLLYHTHTGTWVQTREAPWRYDSPRVVVRDGDITIVDQTATASVEVLSVSPGIGILDSLMIAIYLCGMVAMGFYFIRRGRNAAGYFRGGNRIPWWAVGMSLFATGASAISLMSMPWKGYSENLTYLGISLYALIALPLAIFIIAPLVRRLAIVTPGHYMERRFGLGARMIAASIFCFTQIGARMGAILLLPSIAISAVTGIPIHYCIIVMGIVTTVYTYVGGLGAVVWTDTVQGFVMVAAVIGCLVLAIVRIDTPPADAWEAIVAFERHIMFDFRWDLTYPTAYLLFITTVVGTLMGISDQNFVQRVQATPNLKQTRIAVATQLGVAIPINILLFSLGLVLFLFYRERPEQLDPTMATDGIFPFFVAQEFPVGLSGLVIAALMAATMSTISSSICATANVATEDFFRRFKPGMSERQTVVLGRFLTAIVGISGTLIALYLSQVDVGSIWDLAQMVINVIANGIVGLFALALLTRRAHQVGAILGVVCGYVTIYLFSAHTDISFWAYSFIGTIVTFVSGYFLSVVIPAKTKDTTGLTVYSLGEARPESEEAAQHVGLKKVD